MTSYGLFFDYLWFAPHAVQLVIAILLVRRKLTHEFPAFFLYTIYELLQFVVTAGLYRYRGITDDQYMNIYLVCNIGSALIRFAVVYEIAGYLFREYPALSGVGKKVYRGAAGVLVLVSVGLVAWTSGETKNFLAVWVHIVDRVVSIIQCGLLAVLFAMSRLLRFSWRNHAFGIALGMGLFASVELAVSAVRPYLPNSKSVVAMNLVTMGTYHVCVLIWAWYLWAPERVHEHEGAAVAANELDNWDAALQRVIER
jgi:hypothetical protein